MKFLLSLLDSLLLALKASFIVGFMVICMAGCTGCNLIYPEVFLKPVATGAVRSVEWTFDKSWSIIRFLWNYKVDEKQ